MATQGEDDLVASKTEGFKVGEKKTVEEYAKLGKTVVGFINRVYFMKMRNLLKSTIQSSKYANYLYHRLRYLSGIDQEPNKIRKQGILALCSGCWSLPLSVVSQIVLLMPMSIRPASIKLN